MLLFFFDMINYFISDTQTMDNQTNLVAAQTALMTVIEKLAETIINTPDEEWTVGLVKARLEVLSSYWSNFQSNNVSLLTQDDTNESRYLCGKGYGAAEDNYIAARSQLYDIQARLSSVSTRDEPCATTQSHSKGTHRLPRITIPMFSGRREDWESFRDLFKFLIHEDLTLNNVEKLYYLKAHVEGDAKAALDSLQIVGTNYATAWGILEARYEHQRLLVQDHLSALRSLKVLREETAAGIQGLLDSLERHKDQLRALKRPVDQWDDWFVACAGR